MNRLVTHRQPRVKVMNQAMSTMHTCGATGDSSRIQQQQQASGAAAGLGSACGSSRGRKAWRALKGSKTELCSWAQVEEGGGVQEGGRCRDQQVEHCALPSPMTGIKRRAERC